jgi:flagellar L-ring protein precursor FlgH
MLKTTQGTLLKAATKKLANMKNYLVLINKKLSHGIVIAFASTLLFSCAVTPTSIVNQPTTAKSPAPSNTQNNNGGIYSASSYRPMFEDRRPRFIGDIVTINITENTTATKANGSSASKEGEVGFQTDAKLGDNIPVIGGLVSRLPFAKLGSVSASSDISYTDDAAANARNVFNGSLTATVVDVLPNGNLVVSGEKQIGLDKGTEFIRFSGIINPDTISLGNTVPSTKVADARIEYRTNSKIDGAAIASIFARFFLSMSPW